VPGVATAVLLSGEGDGDKEERLVLRDPRQRPAQAGVAWPVAADFPGLGKTPERSAAGSVNEQQAVAVL